MKKFRTIIIYVVIAAVLIALIAGGQRLFKDEPTVYSLYEFTALVEQGMREAEASKASADTTDDTSADTSADTTADTSVEVSQNTIIYAVQITEETLYGIYTTEYANSEAGGSQKLEADAFKTKVERFEKGKTYDFEVTVTSGADFRDEMARIVSTVTGKDANTVTINDYGFKYIQNATPQTSWFWVVLPYVLLIGGFIVVYVLVARAQGGGKQAMNFGKSNARTGVDSKSKKTFDDVQGADEEKQELQEIVDFLRSPQSFTAMGARIPKGVLLIGPPGTGKTLLAKAVAGEANVPFFSISGSDFVELYVGVGASRVRDLFQTAKRSAPAIIFIDEIDAVGRQRGAGLGGGHDEREQTLNQLLVEMDGFTENQGIIVIAATNRPDILDPALLRPGRFDRQVTVNYPDVKGREAILNLHAKNKPIGDSVNMATLAKLTAGFTGADLENVLNEAAILAARGKLKKIGMSQVEEAIKRVIAGPEKKSRVVSESDKRITANHEVGHAVVARCLKNCDPVHELSIIQRGRAAGYTITLPENDIAHMTRNKLYDMIAGLLGGRVAESLRLEDISTGAENDLKRASELARRMVVEFGMSDVIGPVYLAGETEVFIAKEWGHQRNYSEQIAATIDAEVRRILENQYQRAKEAIENSAAAFDRIVEALLTNEHISGTEFNRLFDGVSDWQDKPDASVNDTKENDALQKDVKANAETDSSAEAESKADAGDKPKSEG